MALNRLGVEAFNNRPPAATTMPAINLPDLDTKAIEAEAREAQARVRVIGAGRYAWEQIAKSGSFSGWVAVGKALFLAMDRGPRLCRNAEERALRRHRVCREYRGHRGVEIDAG
jgi:hypothetical protein